MLKRGKINNCSKCGASYGQYDNNPDSDWSEYWCAAPHPEVVIKTGSDTMLFVHKEPKGLCQFCNPKSRYFLNK